MSSFFNQTTFCPTCGGTGYTDIEDNRLRAKCADCQGNGVFIKQTDALLFFNSSSYFDFFKREKIKSLKIIYFIIFGIIGLFLLVAMYYLYTISGKFLNSQSLSPF